VTSENADLFTGSFDGACRIDAIHGSTIFLAVCISAALSRPPGEHERLDETFRHTIKLAPAVPPFDALGRSSRVISRLSLSFTYTLYFLGLGLRTVGALLYLQRQFKIRLRTSPKHPHTRPPPGTTKRRTSRSPLRERVVSIRSGRRIDLQPILTELCSSMAHVGLRSGEPHGF
jgi:hypothetical protein